MADAITVRKDFPQNLKKIVPVLFIEEDGLAGIAPGGQVVKGAGEFDAQGAGHVEQHSKYNPKIKDLTLFIKASCSHARVSTIRSVPRFQQLAVDYENTVIEAYQEAEDALIAYLRTREQVALLVDAVEAYKNAVDLSSLQYREGLVDFQRVLDSQQNLAQTQDTLIATTGDVVLSLVGLYKALGGGWEIRIGRDFVPREIKEEMGERTDWGDLLSPGQLEYPPSEEVDWLLHWPDW